ncbi:hypothetical protein Acsp06_12800 [Actinomycetospora sp. NBRC 106375]|uniref:hypothetical protein n=1 Tax=Actinomycetospora sp. NBRC 106375 TaxID=3032207 RepID=UPI0024A54D2D|nr:hypothetical protein [Actinomycetospora sp. NBRC 106375]GLZ45095.1 hypothetical protein Acsp06_12800 [Actinomycetospora sp. NBRC 106375]
MTGPETERCRARPGESELWELRVGVIATAAEADALMDRIAGVLDVDAVPWSLAQIPGRHLDDDARAVHESLRE